MNEGNTEVGSYSERVNVAVVNPVTHALDWEAQQRFKNRRAASDPNKVLHVLLTCYTNVIKFSCWIPHTQIIMPAPT
jgi:hypothetical protein